MAESPLIVKSKAFALEVIRVCKELRVEKCESALINQFLWSGTSIGANIREAFYAHSQADFIAKLQHGSCMPQLQIIYCYLSTREPCYPIQNPN